MLKNPSLLPRKFSTTWDAIPIGSRSRTTGSFCRRRPGHLHLPRPQKQQYTEVPDLGGRSVYPPLPASRPALGIYAHSALWFPRQPLQEQNLSRCRQLLGLAAPPVQPAPKSVTGVDARTDRSRFLTLPSLPPRNSDRYPNPAGGCPQSTSSENGFVMNRCPHPPARRPPAPHQARRRPGRCVPPTCSTDSVSALTHPATAPHAAGSNAKMAPLLLGWFPDGLLQHSTPRFSRLQSP